jgi:hypothetical protein
MRGRYRPAVPPISCPPAKRTRCLTANSRFATGCCGLRIGCQRNRTVTRAKAIPPTSMALRAPGGPQDARSDPGRSNVRLSSNVAPRTRIGRDSGASELRIAICYGLRGFANWDKAGAGPWPHHRSRRDRQGPVSAACFDMRPLCLPRRVGRTLRRSGPTVRPDRAVA